MQLNEKKINSNVLAPEDFSVHSWYRFVLSYPPHLVRKYLEIFNARMDHVILDPFCGTGTTLVESQKNGLMSIGIDALPFAAFVSRVKTHWNISTQKLRKIRSEIIELTTDEFSYEDMDTLSFTHLLFKDSSEYRLTDEEEELLPTGFLSQRPLKRLLILKKSIQKACNHKKMEERNFFNLALCHITANGAGNFAFGPEIYRTKPKPDYDVLGHFVEHTETMIRNIEEINSNKVKYIEANVICGDSRKIEDIQNKIDIVITSPPYPNEKDYTRTTRVESILLGFVDKKERLRQIKYSMLRSNTRNVFVRDTDATEVKEFKSIQRVCAEIENRRIELNKTSGFEKLYHKVVAHYFGGMRKHLHSLKPLLNRHAKLAYVVGDQFSFLMVPVYTAKLLAEIAEAEGYQVHSIDLWRERIGTKVKNSKNGDKTVRIREEVLILEKR